VRPRSPRSPRNAAPCCCRTRRSERGWATVCAHIRETIWSRGGSPVVGLRVHSRVVLQEERDGVGVAFARSAYQRRIPPPEQRRSMSDAHGGTTGTAFGAGIGQKEEAGARAGNKSVNRARSRNMQRLFGVIRRTLGGGTHLADRLALGHRAPAHDTSPIGACIRQPTIHTRRV
jgi:hypothetical protein